ncbi:MAG: phosphosulfolactate synthase [Bacteroidales bacterium]|nr:phosphosulfolactate synthase [Bacteroidales bacterium]
MNYTLPFIPQRSGKPRQHGLTMVMDKGLSLTEAASMVEASGEHIDFVKLGFGTSLITNKLHEKVQLYQQAGIRPYLGGTLFELFVVRGMFDDFVRFVDSLGLDLVEVSDGSMRMDHRQKCAHIAQLAKRYTVISEVGSKQADVVIPDADWVRMMRTELEHGAWKVIAEARESGNTGIYNKDHSANTKLIADIAEQVGMANVIWEAPLKAQQVWFIKQLGAEVNLGNIATNEVVPLETLRLGLRGDTFFMHLPDHLKQ